MQADNILGSPFLIDFVKDGLRATFPYFNFSIKIEHFDLAPYVLRSFFGNNVIRVSIVYMPDMTNGITYGDMFWTRRISFIVSFGEYLVSRLKLLDDIKRRIRQNAANHFDIQAYLEFIGEHYTYSSCQPGEIRRANKNKEAEDLLMLCLNDMQLSQYQENETFICYGNITNTAYRVLPKSQVNIEVLDRDLHYLKKACIVPTETIPIEDHMLSIKMIIENNESLFLEKVIYWA